jgi:hypothetical protein
MIAVESGALIPVPLMLSTYVMKSWSMFGASFYFGAAHAAMLAMTR